MRTAFLLSGIAGGILTKTAPFATNGALTRAAECSTGGRTDNLTT